MYAVIEISGKQQIVKQDEVLKVDRLKAETGESVTITKVLALGEGGNLNFGNPFISGASVVFEVLENKKDKKVIVFKKKRRKNYRKSRGHRQDFSQILIEKIALS